MIDECMCVCIPDVCVFWHVISISTQMMRRIRSSDSNDLHVVVLEAVLVVVVHHPLVERR